MSKNIRILICDDDPIVHQSLSLYLDNEDFLHDSAYDGMQALEMTRKEHYDLMLLDQMMPGMSGMEVCQSVRRESNLPIIMLTARGEEIDRILGLEMGADDYIVKPFSPREVVSRIKAVLRRCEGRGAQPAVQIIKRDNLEVNLEEHKVIVDGEEAVLTLKEFELLKKFLLHPGIVFSRDKLLNDIWGYEFTGETRTVDVHIRTLRQKLGSAGDLVETIRGVGYRMAATK